MTWLRLEVRRRWRSLLVLALLVALATATVLAAAAGARRGQTAFDRLWASTLPSTVTVLPNQPGFDWDKVRALPEVAAVSEFPVAFGFSLDCCPEASTGFPPIGTGLTQTMERPVLEAGRLFNPGRVDEILVSPQFAAAWNQALTRAHQQLVTVLSGDSQAIVVQGGTVTLDLAPFIDAAK